MATRAAVLAVVRAARPRFNKPPDALAFALHAALLVEGYSLVAVGAAADPPVAATAVAAADVMDTVVDPAVVADVDADPVRGWNAWEDAYAFRYVSDATGDEVLVKAMVAGDAIMVNAVVVPTTTHTARCRGFASLVAMETLTPGSPTSSAPAATEFRVSTHVDTAAVNVHDVPGSLVRLDDTLEQARRELFVPLARAVETAVAARGVGARGSGKAHTTTATTAAVAASGGVAGGASRVDRERERERNDRRGNERDGRGRDRDGDDLDPLRIGGPRRPGLGPGPERGGFYPPQPGVPPLGARFDPYGPPDIPGFAPGRFGEEPDPMRGGGGGGDGYYGGSHNPDHDFGGVPNGGWPGQGGGAGRGGAGPPGWPQRRGGRGRGFNPDLGPPDDDTWTTYMSG